MMNEFLRAGGNGEGIFWTIVVIIWIIGKASAANRKIKKTASPAAPRPSIPPSPLKPKLSPANLQSFLDSLTGTRTPQKPFVTREMQHHQIVKKQKPVMETTAPDILEPHSVPATVQLSQQTSNFSTSVRDLIANIPSARMPNLSMGFSAPITKGAHLEKPDLRNRAQMRKAMIAHFILIRPESAGW